MSSSFIGAVLSGGPYKTSRAAVTAYAKKAKGQECVYGMCVELLLQPGELCCSRDGSAFLQVAHNTGKCEVDGKINEGGKSKNDGYLSNADRLPGVARKQSQSIAGPEHEFRNGHHGQEGRILDDCGYLTQQGGHNVVKALGQDNITQRLHKAESLRSGCFKLSLRNGVQPAPDNLRHGCGGKQDEGEGTAQKDIGQRGIDITDQHPHQIRGVAEDFNIYSGQSAQDKFFIVAQECQNQPEDDAAYDNYDGQLQHEEGSVQKVGEYLRREGTGDDINHASSSSMF